MKEFSFSGHVVILDFTPSSVQIAFLVSEEHIIPAIRIDVDRYTLDLFFDNYNENKIETTFKPNVTFGLGIENYLGNEVTIIASVKVKKKDNCTIKAKWKIVLDMDIFESLFK